MIPSFLVEFLPLQDFPMTFFNSPIVDLRWGTARSTKILCGLPTGYSPVRIPMTIPDPHVSRWTIEPDPE